ncbi:hypothetical protein [Methylobacterium sp. WSM2598]|uniref:hypothetical protein n=1 Tax=Methylobacterium sp. WSM2598 TaxID=398261 RepID=UPI0012F69C09|nr:hypothetical protein [Methylobacterium sp. WSM2598]
MSINPPDNIGQRCLDEIWNRYAARIGNPEQQISKYGIIDSPIYYFEEAGTFFAEYYLTYYCDHAEYKGHTNENHHAILKEVINSSIRIMHIIGIHSNELEEVITDTVVQAYWGCIREISLSSSDTGGTA